MLGERSDIDLGPPVLLKRLGNILEANLVHARLESAGIPSFIDTPDAFAGATARPESVGLYVPERFVTDALDLLDHPPTDDATDDATWPDDPGRPFAFRALVASVAGWTIVFLTIVGLLMAVPTFAYAIVLALRAARRSTHLDRGLRLQVVASVALSTLGLAMSGWISVELMSAR